MCWSLYVCVCVHFNRLFVKACVRVDACECVSSCRVSVLCVSPVLLSLFPDGLMVQITVETMAELRRSLREMKDYTVTCGRLDQSDSQEIVCVQWVEEKCTVNKGWVCLFEVLIAPLDWSFETKQSRIATTICSDSGGKCSKGFKLFFMIFFIILSKWS